MSKERPTYNFEAKHHLKDIEDARLPFVEYGFDSAEWKAVVKTASKHVEPNVDLASMTTDRRKQLAALKDTIDPDVREGTFTWWKQHDWTDYDFEKISDVLPYVLQLDTDDAFAQAVGALPATPVIKPWHVHALFLKALNMSPGALRLATCQRLGKWVPKCYKDFIVGRTLYETNQKVNFVHCNNMQFRPQLFQQSGGKSVNIPKSFSPATPRRELFANAYTCEVGVRTWAYPNNSLLLCTFPIVCVRHLIDIAAYDVLHDLLNKQWIVPAMLLDAFVQTHHNTYFTRVFDNFPQLVTVYRFFSNDSINNPQKALFDVFLVLGDWLFVKRDAVWNLDFLKSTNTEPAETKRMNVSALARAQITASKINAARSAATKNELDETRSSLWAAADSRNLVVEAFARLAWFSLRYQKQGQTIAAMYRQLVNRSFTLYAAEGAPSQLLAMSRTVAQQYNADKTLFIQLRASSGRSFVREAIRAYLSLATNAQTGQMAGAALGNLDKVAKLLVEKKEYYGYTTKMTENYTATAFVEVDRGLLRKPFMRQLVFRAACLLVRTHVQQGAFYPELLPLQRTKYPETQTEAEGRIEFNAILVAAQREVLGADVQFAYERRLSPFDYVQIMTLLNIRNPGLALSTQPFVAAEILRATKHWIECLLDNCPAAQNIIGDIFPAVYDIETLRKAQSAAKKATLASK
jgi:hypothetical protein